MKLELLQANGNESPGSTQVVTPNVNTFILVSTGRAKIIEITESEKKNMRAIAVGGAHNMASLLGKLADRQELLIKLVVPLLETACAKLEMELPSILKEMVVGDTPITAKGLSDEAVANEGNALAASVSRAIQGIEQHFPK